MATDRSTGTDGAGRKHEQLLDYHREMQAVHASLAGEHAANVARLEKLAVDATVREKGSRRSEESNPKRAAASRWPF